MFVKFSDWVNTISSTATVPTFDNTRLLLNEDGGALLASEEDVENGFSLGNDYKDQAPSAIDISGVDLNESKPGRQVQFDIFVKLPVDTLPGFYTTEFGILTEISG